jgi:hypothetical protein
MRMTTNIGPVELVMVAMSFLAVLAGFAFMIWPAWRICSKAGFSGALGILIVIPLANVFLLFFLAFAEWPSLRQKKAYSSLDE